jgi:hypothetical protein
MRLHPVLAQITRGGDGCCHMPPALDTVTGAATAIGATLAALTANSGDSFQVKNAPLTTQPLLLNAWADVQAAGVARIRSPKLHDNVDAIRSRTRVNCLDPLLPFGMPEMLWPQDTLIVELAGSAVGGQIESIQMLIYYPDLPGQQARLIDMPTLRQRAVHYFGQRLAITVGSTAAYTGSRAINADADLMIANTDYAVLGITTDLRVAGISLRGPDTGNLRVTVPGGADVLNAFRMGAWWFKQLAIEHGLPLIPVINSANKGATQIDVMGDNNGGTANVTIWLMQLK